MGATDANSQFSRGVHDSFQNYVTTKPMELLAESPRAVHKSSSFTQLNSSSFLKLHRKVSEYFYPYLNQSVLAK